MPIPTRTQTLSTFVAATAENRRPGLVDNVFDSAALLARLRRRNNVPVRGGEVIKVQHIYTGFTASSYGRGDTFDTNVTEFATALTFDWKFSYAAVNLDTIDVELNDSPERVFDIVDAAIENGELSLIDDMSTQIFADGTGNTGKDMDGLANAVSQSGSYGGITRSATSGTPGFSIRSGAEDSTGGVLSLTALNTQFGNTVIAREKPDLIVTTQTLWNRIWERSQPSERNSAGDLRDIGFEVVRFNGADVTEDSHTPSGLLYLLNTKWWELFVHPRWDFRFRGFLEPTSQQRQVGQLIAWANLVCRSPRTQGVMSGLS